MNDKPSIRVLVCGGKLYNDWPELFLTLDSIHKLRPLSLVISGNWPGADTLATVWAFLHGLPHLFYDGQWDGDQRPHLVLAFEGGRGTQRMVDLADRLDLMVWIIDPKDLHKVYHDGFDDHITVASPGYGHQLPPQDLLNSL